MADDGAVIVCVRMRPLIESENSELGGKETIAWKSEKCSISQVDGTKSFTFDRVFHSEESTAEVYKEIADPIIKAAVRGYNGTIFAYGQTASGKTYTMLGTKSCAGILPMAIEDVFKTICRIPDREFLLRISYMEIHNETIQDLLCSSIRKKKPLVVREDINRNIYVEDLIEEVVVSPEQVKSWLQKGEKNRHYGETKMNARSSRSHTIFRMIIESKEKTDASNSNYDGAVMVSHLNLVDLAGSERASQTGTDGIRLKEGCCINRSLFILGQVIKKLCDDQSGVFINYRDSKLTRILQNSLGGNAKTAIICTVTPVSLEETLSTLQFASTAKKMKNSPKVNEVLDDDALLKRYRREIEDLKRRLEEVSSDCQTRDEEKDQLAQLLEEKNSLQKEQQERIRTLAEMVVSSTFLREQALKNARKKRRVTWTPGQISLNREMFSENFPESPKRFKASLPALSELEESVSSEFSEYDDTCLSVGAAVPEEVFIPGPEISLIHKGFADSVMLCETLVAERDSAVTKQQATQAELETLQVEKEQLSQEVRELAEKIETKEFTALEIETLREHEMQLMHEISTLKAVIANTEGYDQDLQDKLKSKELQLMERENKITAMEKEIIKLNNLLEEARKAGGGNKGGSSAGTFSQMMEEMKRSLSDAEIVAMDAKKESAFLRRENLALKERLDQLSDDYNHMKKEAECYKSQLEASKVTYKKMQSDLQKELQYYFQENTKLTSLLEGKVPKDNHSSGELDEKMQLKNKLNEALEENISLRKEVAALSETSLNPDLDILHKEILEKSETITSLTSERETLLSQVAAKEQRLLEMTDALKSKEDFVNAEALREKNEAVGELKRHCHELRQELATVSEENKQIKGQIEKLSGENLKLNATINEMVEELSRKSQELQAKDLEQEKLLRMEEELSHVLGELNSREQLKDQLKGWESKVEAGEVERLAIVQRLQGREEEISALAQERDELKQMLEAVQRERDQIKDDIEETVAMNIEAQSELRNSQASLKQCQNEVKELQAMVLKKESQTASIKETLETIINEQKLQILKLTEDLEQATLEKNPLSTREALLEEDEIQLMREQISCLEEEKTKLQQQLETLQEERDLSQESRQSLTSHMQVSQAEGVQAEELIGVKEELVQALQKLSEMTEHLKASESRMEVDKMAMAQELSNHEEAVRSLTQERDDLRRERDALQLERDRVQEEMKATQSVLSSKIQELQDKEQEEFLQMIKEQHSREAQENNGDINHLKALESKLEAEEREKLEMAEKLQQVEEERKSLIPERDDLKQKWDAVQMEKEELKELLKDATLKLSSKIQELEAAEKELLQMQEQFCGETQENQSFVEELKEQLRTLESKLEAEEREKLEMAERLRNGDEERKSLALERDDLKYKWDTAQIEKEKLKELLEGTTSKVCKELMLTSDVQGLQAKNTQEEELVLVKEELSQALQKLREMEELREQLKATECSKEADRIAAAQALLEHEEAIRALVQERDNLRHQLDALQQERDRLQEEMSSTPSMLSSTIQQLQAEAGELLQTKEQLCGEAQEYQNKMEQLTEQLRTLESKLEAQQREKLEMAERLRDGEEERKALVLERDGLKQKWDALQIENEKFKELLEETTAKLTSNTDKLQARNTQEEALIMAKLREMEELREQLKVTECRMEADKMAAAQELREHEEAVRALLQEREDLRLQRDALQQERDQVQEQLSSTQSMLSSKIQELQVEARELLQTKELLYSEVQRNQSEMEQLTEQLRTLESKLEAKEREKLEMAERLQDGEEERKTLVLERDGLKQKWDALQIENEKFKELLEETTAKLTSNIEELQARNTQEEELITVKEELSQALQKLREMEELKEQLKARECRMQADKMAAAQELHKHEEAVRALVQEREDLRLQRDALQQERDRVQEEMSSTQSMLSSKIQELQAEAGELLQSKEQLCGEAQEYQNKMEQLTEQLRTLESKLEAQQREKLEMVERLQDGEEERKTLVLERDGLKQKWDALQIENEKFKELLEETTAKLTSNTEMLHARKTQEEELIMVKEELSQALQKLGEMEDLREQLKVTECRMEANKMAAAQELREHEEAVRALLQEREDLRLQRDALQQERDQFQEELSLTQSTVVDTQTGLEKLLKKTKSQEQEVARLERLIVGQEEQLLKREAKLIEEMGQMEEKFSKTIAKLEQDLHELRQQLEEARQEKTPEGKEQDDLEKLQAKVSKIMEALQKLSMIEKRYEYLGRIADNLKTEVNNQKELATKILEEVSCEKAKQIRRLQMEHEFVGNSLHRLLNKVQYLLTRLCKTKSKYYSNISNHTAELLGERRKQHELLTQIRSLKDPCWNSHAAVSQQLHNPELNQNLDFYVEQIWKDVSEMDEEIGTIEVMLQQLESSSREVKEYSVPFDIQDFETGIKQDSERLFPAGRLLKPKPQALIQMREELESRNANYCKEAEATLKSCRERTRELMQALDTLKEQQAPRGRADLLLEEENYRLESKLKAQDQDMQDLKLKIQELENAANEARKNLLEREKRIAVLEMELKVRASRSEVVRLRAALEEKENCLTSTQMENQTLKAQLNKGAELYKEEIEDLKVQLAKADMTLIKQSKSFDREMANAKALAEHRDEQLRKLREDLRKAQLEQDATIVPNQDFPQPLLSITCGGGSGIVQNTQMLVLKSEHAKLEREVDRLKKEHELALKKELHLKEEVKKWKERALKMREQSRVMNEEQRLKSPRKTAPPLLTELPSSPSKECSLRPSLALDAPPVVLNCPTTFFDNSRLGTFDDVSLPGGEPTETAPSENSLKQWMARTSKEGTPECKTQ